MLKSEFQFIHGSDVHTGIASDGRENPDTGINTRTEVVLKAVQDMIDYAKAHEIKLIILSGDIFDNKSPGLNNINAFNKLINYAAKNGIFIYILDGNHDSTAYRQRASAVEHFSTIEIPNVYETRGGEGILDLGYAQIVSVCYYQTTEEMVAYLDDIAEKIDWDRPAILVTHLQIEYADFPGAHRVNLPFTPMSVLTKHPWTYVACGHIHKVQELNEKPPVWYAGSLTRLDFAEEFDPKGFLLVTLKGNKTKRIEQVPVETLEFKTFKGDMPSVKAQIEAFSCDDISKHLFRLVIDETDEPIDEQYIRNKLKGAFAMRIKKVPRKITQSKRIAVTNEGNSETYLKAFFHDDEDEMELVILARELHEAEAAKQ